ncbi:hypothetical protein PSTT_11689 [Puccinia striiformis]|uniref:Myb/SANT-like domain-containing protein n=3 Tax=Puccinia striiformis TaxID=27350 RepID=A0A2S4UZA1_9BASI|nr:hypothetical protein PSTT_11689 [Puccinia striiformis]
MGTLSLIFGYVCQAQQHPAILRTPGYRQNRPINSRGDSSKTARFLFSRASYLIKTFDHKGAMPLQRTLLPPQVPTSNSRAEPGVDRAQTLQDMIDARSNEWNSFKVLAINPLGAHPTQSTPTATPQHPLDWPNPPTSRQRENGTSPNNKTDVLQNPQNDISVTWTPTHTWHCDHTTAFLEAILDQQHKSKYESATGDLESQGWTNLAEIMNKKFGAGYHHIWLRSRLDHIRKLYLDTKLLRNRFGFQWNESTSMVTADNNAWKRLVEEDPNNTLFEFQYKSISWYSLAERVFSGSALTNKQLPSFFNHSQNQKREIPNNETSSLNTGINSSTMQPLANKRNNETLSLDDDGNAPSSPESRATKQPRLSSRGLTNEQIDIISNAFADSDSANTVQPTLVTQSESEPLNPPIDPGASAKLCVLEKMNGTRAPHHEDQGGCGVSSSSVPRPQNQSQRPETNLPKENVEISLSTISQKNVNLQNPTIGAITMMASLFVDQVSTLEFVRFIQVVENEMNATIFLSLISTTNTSICKTWLLQKANQIQI